MLFHTLFLAATEVEPFVINRATAVIATLDGVTTVLVAFILVCVIFPSIVKNRTQYYAALASVIGVLLLHALSLMLHESPGIIVLAGAFSTLLQIVALLMLILSVGGLSPRELAGDMARAYEVLRRGETEKEVIIPIGGRKHRDETPSSQVYHVDTTTGATTTKSPDDSGIPLE